MPRLLFSRNGSWDSIQDWPKASILDQCRGPPFLLESDYGNLLNIARKTLETSTCPGFLSFPLVTPACPTVSPSSRDGQQFSDDACDSKTWRISLDVSHFCPEEICVKINEGYLEIAGKHQERHKDRGTISRSFTRNYKLPAEVDPQKMNFSFSPEGVLLVEVPVGVSSNSCPKETAIPIQMKEKH
ncbi:heat shock protein, alpha-crystallin-related, b15 [Tachysurus fulvidraco]|uniref:heat shock protein, alpha-crystallin-related, b15 n=1 Tax=Tachysurus fulvidraco TaxID=1234273 RepID=UPI000F4FFE8F|nr:heat shock protein, alpha-crystallin-related, b15 [Tachysurus fulvidraco]